MGHWVVGFDFHSLLSCPSKGTFDSSTSRVPVATSMRVMAKPRQPGIFASGNHVISATESLLQALHLMVCMTELLPELLFGGSGVARAAESTRRPAWPSGSGALIQQSLRVRLTLPVPGISPGSN